MEKKSTLVTCSMIAGALLSVSAITANTNSLLNYNGLGTAGEVRTSLVKTIELNCGEKKDATKTDTKTKDAKCGEHKDAKAKDGKCGEHKDTKAKDGKCGEKKAKDGKCGEGKCGEKKKTDTPK